MTTKTDCIRELDGTRAASDLETGGAMITPGVAALGNKAVNRIVKLILTG